MIVLKRYISAELAA